MKFLIVGLGSMGKRRIRNLQYLKAGEIMAFEPVEARRKEAEKTYGIRVFGNIEEALAQSPDAIIISTPPDKHHPYAMLAAKNNKHFFVEASVISDGMTEIIEVCRNRNIVAAPSCTMRFHPAVKKIKELVDSNAIGKILTFTYHSGMYLPDWHPWEDYRTFYVSKKASGACREIVPYELTWIMDVMGTIKTISSMKGKLTNLETEIDDAYQILMKFESGMLGHMLVDVISRVPYRSLKLMSEEGVITWEWGVGIRVYNAKDKSWVEYPEQSGTSVEGYDKKIKEEPYIEEMQRFIEAIQGKRDYPYTMEDDYRVLCMLNAAEKSSQEGLHVSI
jgi:predicted dehydrogenase